MSKPQTLDPSQIQNLQEAREAAGAALARRRLAHFCTRLNPNLVFQRYHQEVFVRLEALARGEIENLLIALPPRHTKTELVSNNFPAWYLGQHPESKLILASYGLGLATRNSRRARNKLEEPEWPFPDVRLADDSKAVEYWGTNQGGEVLAAGVDSTITGHGADILIIDDPFKNRAEADSAPARNHVWDWYRDDALGRLQPDGRVVLCSTRWHEDDLTGRILNEEGALNEWEVLCLPALAEAGDPIGREVGEPLDPIRYSAEALNRRRRRVGPRAWNALYQQRPGSESGNFFKKSWWRYYSREQLIRQGLTASVICVDPAIGQGKDNDYSAVTVWGHLEGAIYLLDIWAERVPFVELRPHLVALQQTWRAPLLVEDVGPGKILLQSLRESSRLDHRYSAVQAIPWKLNAVAGGRGQAPSKAMRAESITPVIEGGQVFLPLGHERLDLYLEQLTDFPTGRYDDLVDTTVMGVNRLVDQLDAAYDIYFNEFGSRAS